MMLNFTKTAIDKTVADFKKLDFYRNLLTQFLYITYLIYALCVGAGVLWANITLLALSLVYLCIFSIATHLPNQKNVKQWKRTVRKVYRRSKLFIRFFTLGVMVYGIYAATTHVSALSVILCAMTVVGWVLQVIFEIILQYIINRAELLYQGVKADYETLIKPVKTVGNFFKKAFRKEDEQPPQEEKPQSRLWLEEQVNKKQMQRKAEKEKKRERNRDNNQQ